MRTKRKLTNKELEDVLARIKTIADLPLPVLEIELDDYDVLPVLNATFEADLKYDFKAVPPPIVAGVAPVRFVRTSGSRKISIRIPNQILEDFKAKAESSGTQYQTLIVQSLKKISSEWTT
jgi:predicted DNA binding CopG/RHH family protein